MSPSRYFFKQVPYPMTARDACSSIYISPSEAELDLFLRINGLKTSDHLPAGRLVMAPSLGGVSESTYPSIQRLGEQFAFEQRHSSHAPAPAAFNNHFEYVSRILDVSAKMAGYAGEMGAYRDLFGKTMDFQSAKLSELNRRIIEVHIGHMDAAAGKLDAAGRKTLADKKRFIEVQSRNMQLKINEVGGARGALRSIDAQRIHVADQLRAFATSGSPMSAQTAKNAFSAVDDAMAEIAASSKRLLLPLGATGDQFSRVAKGAGKAAPFLSAMGLAVSAVDITRKSQAFDAARPGTGAIAQAYGTAQLLGGWGAGGLAGLGATKLVMGGLLFTPVGWGGLALAGIVVVGAGVVVGLGGEYAAGEWAKNRLKLVDPTGGDDVEWVTENFENGPPVELHAKP